MPQRIPTPEEFFGFPPGSDRKMIHWHDLVAYYRRLAEISDHVKIETCGKTTEGNEFVYLIFSSKENLERLEEYRQWSRLAADPRKADRETLERLYREGKAVCYQQYSIHSNEVGGAQMCPILAYELAKGEGDRIRKILDNVIFLMVPCGNPDGEIIFYDWYQSTLGKSYEGCCYPGLYHRYAGHSNNRDFIHERLIETRYINDILYRKWMPQAVQDHHHQAPAMDRMSISPKMEPVWEELSPLLLREDALYGAKIAAALEEQGVAGVCMGDEHYNGMPTPTMEVVCNHHNIVGLLGESADAMIATPVFLRKEELGGHREPSFRCPNPWQGGEWHLSDIVFQQKIASLALLEEMADNREQVLRRMVHKALDQTRRGAESGVAAYAISSDVHDPSALCDLLGILQRMGIEFFTTETALEADGISVPAGSFLVPTAQPNYSLLTVLLSKKPYPISKETVMEDGSIKIFDVSSYHAGLPMGIDTLPLKEWPAGTVSPGQIPLMEETPTQAENNFSFRTANRWLKAGRRVFRTAKGDFTLQKKEAVVEIRPRKLVLFSTSASCMPDFGNARFVLDQFEFPFRIVMDRDFREGTLPEFDTVLFPGNQSDDLRLGDRPIPDRPPEYQFGLGKAGAERLRNLICDQGKTLIAWEASCAYMIETFRLSLRDRVADRPRFRGTAPYGPTYNTLGSVLAVEPQDRPIGRGLPERVPAVLWCSPAFEVATSEETENCQICAHYAAEAPLLNGILVGEKLIAGQACVVRAKAGKGQALLYAFDPIRRAQATATFKLLFNALYEEIPLT